MAFPKSSQILLLSVFFTIAALDPTAKPVLPHIVDCFSANMETFRCHWSSGSLHNLSEPGALRLFYLNKPSVVDWLECPEYSTERLDECFFSENHTTVWTNYRVQLRSSDQKTVYDESVFNVFERVRPDPPSNLSFVVLTSSISGQYFDSLIRWSPPESADVKSGWMRLKYQLQHRDATSNVWKASDLLDSTHSSVFGLHTDVRYEVRVRCKTLGMEFGDFSESIYIYNTSTVSRFPVAALLIFGALCLVAILMLIIISQQEKLMFLLLPPIPGPKIQGIDPELLKKGKLRELSSILGSSELRPELYSADPWVEFIELDLDKTSDDMTHCLLPGSPSHHRTPDPAGFRDDDSGRASCCDPDLHSDAENSPFQPNALEETSNHPNPDSPLTQEAVYTQVSEVRLSGNVVLSPEEDVSCAEEPDLKHKLTKNTAGYTSDVNAGKITDVSTSAAMFLLPAPAYTVVEAVDKQNSLLLGPNLLSSKPTPEGYLTPEQFGGSTP